MSRILNHEIDQYKSPLYHITHYPAIKETSTSCKLRVTSFNQLKIELLLREEFLFILIRFGEYKLVFGAAIAMYRMVLSSQLEPIRYLTRFKTTRRTPRFSCQYSNVYLGKKGTALAHLLAIYISFYLFNVTSPNTKTIDRVG